MVVEGIKTTIPLHLKIMDDPKFRAGDISTSFMEYFLAQNGSEEKRLVGDGALSERLLFAAEDAYNTRLFQGPVSSEG